MDFSQKLKIIYFLKYLQRNLEQTKIFSLTFFNQKLEPRQKTMQNILAPLIKQKTMENIDAPEHVFLNQYKRNSQSPLKGRPIMKSGRNKSTFMESSPR
jgi:hypothetical protein